VLAVLSRDLEQQLYNWLQERVVMPGDRDTGNWRSLCNDQKEELWNVRPY
jgi:hypothetical protein